MLCSFVAKPDELDEELHEVEGKDYDSHDAVSEQDALAFLSVTYENP
jgi:hypothetical protein